ncbi:hypothetical protein GCM10010917_36480 [Paenibacillus physcomitrellae]|uniref:Uncharacterized protein n=1 Tax=Paenibacillus physcomitrellae TaxID=1619311 RepID=A0ABQ1GPI1_9BACL|nr:hypothetical protein [Paenibacillus physcomitrellae]GGA47880.1 hypothetical protein GCM10010917_36480 [Paenibacillus physcomitrellae]
MNPISPLEAASRGLAFFEYGRQAKQFPVTWKDNKESQESYAKKNTDYAIRSANVFIMISSLNRFY